MSLSLVDYVSDGSATTFNVPFDYISRSHVYVLVDDVGTDDFTWTSDSIIELDAPATNGLTIRIQRVTPNSAPLVDFVNGSTLDADADLDLAVKQLLFIAQETADTNAGLVAPTGTVNTTDLADGAVTNAKRADMAAKRISGRNTGTGAPQDLTPAQARDVLDVEPDDSTLEINSGELRVKAGGITPNELAVSVGLIPTGSVLPYGGSSAPTGWVLCNGAIYDRTDGAYSSLYAAIGTNFGAGGGGVDFQVPDLRGRAPIGAGTGAGLTARTRGQTGGEETHLQTVEEMPAHNHGETAGQPSGTFLGSGSTSHLATVDVGGSDPFNVMQPYLVLNFIIKL